MTFKLLDDKRNVMLCATCGKPAAMVAYDTTLASSVWPTPVQGYYCAEHAPYRLNVAPDGTSSQRQPIYDAIDQEREAQDVQWGGPAHDDTHMAFDWFHFMDHQFPAVLDGWNLPDPREAGDDLRSRLVKIAALAVAAIESHDRIVATQAADGALSD